MKTVFIDSSPKKKMSASEFIAAFTGVFVKGRKEYLKLRTPSDYEHILEAVKDADNVVFAMPLYVDGIPSHVLPFLKKMEEFSRKNNLKAGIYVISNCGFIEGKQTEPLMQCMENFCIRSGLSWRGGLGIGGGVMMNVMRIMVLVFLGMLLFRFAISGIFYKNWLPAAPLELFGRQMLSVCILGCGIISFDVWLAACINRKRAYGKHYTRIMVPSFVFIIFADIFFIIISLFSGGMFKGWLSKKKPLEKN